MANFNRTLLSPVLACTQVARVKKRLEEELMSLERELNNLPAGSLYIKKNRKWILFYERKDGKSRCINKDQDLIYALARKQFVILLIQFIEELLYELDSEIDPCSFSGLLAAFDELLDKFERGGLEIDRITMTPNQYIWNSNRESQKQNRREELIYPTIGRVYMRTKSEQTLGNLLERLGIPYRYESNLYIKGIIYHPDFIIMLPNGRLIIIEHVGRLDLKNYNEELLFRLIAYNSVGLLIGRDVFFTFERDTRDEVLLKETLFQILSSTPSDSKVLRKVALDAGCHFDD